MRHDLKALCARACALGNGNHVYGHVFRDCRVTPSVSPRWTPSPVSSLEDVRDFSRTQLVRVAVSLRTPNDAFAPRALGSGTRDHPDPVFLVQQGLAHRVLLRLGRRSIVQHDCEPVAMSLKFCSTQPTEALSSVWDVRLTQDSAVHEWILQCFWQASEVPTHDTKLNMVCAIGPMRLQGHVWVKRIHPHHPVLFHNSTYKIPGLQKSYEFVTCTLQDTRSSSDSADSCAFGDSYHARDT